MNESGYPCGAGHDAEVPQCGNCIEGYGLAGTNCIPCADAKGKTLRHLVVALARKRLIELAMALLAVMWAWPAIISSVVHAKQDLK